MRQRFHFPGTTGQALYLQSCASIADNRLGDRLSKAGSSVAKQNYPGLYLPLYRTIPVKIDDRSLTEEFRYQRFCMALYKPFRLLVCVLLGF
jgi:hypothetical protein